MIVAQYWNSTNLILWTTLHVTIFKTKIRSSASFAPAIYLKTCQVFNNWEWIAIYLAGLAEEEKRQIASILYLPAAISPCTMCRYFVCHSGPNISKNLRRSASPSYLFSLSGSLIAVGNFRSLAVSCFFSLPFRLAYKPVRIFWHCC